MTPDMITCTMDQKVSEILRTIPQATLIHLPVTIKGRPVSILNLREIFKDHVSTLKSENRTLRDLFAALD